MNVQIGAEATPFPEKENIKGIFIAVWMATRWQKLFIWHPGALADKNKVVANRLQS